MKKITIADLRAKCKDKSDHDFVDAMEEVVNAYENTPYKELEYIIPIGKFTKDWDKYIKEMIDSGKF